MSEPSKHVVVGKFGAVYGIKGWLKVHSYTDETESIFDYQPLLIKQKGRLQEVQVTDWRRHNKGLVAKLEGFDLREDAQSLVGIEILVNDELLPELDSDEFYWRDLMGCKVTTSKGYDLGTVDDIMETGSNDVLVVKSKPNDAFGKKERLIPYLEEQVIVHVDITNKLIEVDWDPGF